VVIAQQNLKHLANFYFGLPAARCCGEECVVLLQRAEEDPQRRVSVFNHVCEGIRFWSVHDQNNRANQS